MTKYQRSKTRSLALNNPLSSPKGQDSVWQVEPITCVIVVLTLAVFLT